ncbi:MAG TPA: hypothetical protein VFQ15_11235, partial [Jiangellaceae bacterium]|nr:hypothetical protein [Jiangellaceae bacterium]
MRRGHEAPRSPGAGRCDGRHLRTGVGPPQGTPTGDRVDDTHDRVRHDKVDKAGKITWRYQGRLYSIGIGRTDTQTRVIVLAQDRD